MENKRAIGEELDSGETILSTYVVSNADPQQTYVRLLGKENLSPGLRRKIDRINYSTSCLSLFLVVDYDLEARGFDSGNYWLYWNDDINAVYEKGLTDYNQHEIPEALFVTATSLKDPSKKRRKYHQLEVFVFSSFEGFSKWEDQVSGDRDWEYQQQKERISERMLSALSGYLPGIQNAIVHRSLGTPLTNHHYIRAYRWNTYGIDKSVWQAGLLGFPIRTEFKNLFMCGASTVSFGIAGATSTGLIAAARILKCSPEDLIREPQSELMVYQSEDVSTWPANIREKFFNLEDD